MTALLDFLKEKMSMTAIYQPVIIKELLENDGSCSVPHLAKKLVEYDVSVLDYYKKIVMRWPKSTLIKHSIVEYDKSLKSFYLIPVPTDETEKETAIAVCDSKINEWLTTQKNEGAPSANTSLRYTVLKNSKGRCELCGTPSSRRPLDIDHIVPRSKAKHGKVRKGGKLIPLNSAENLQALCFKCNRAKRDTDDTDFRRTKKLVRDKIPDMIRSEGRQPKVKTLTGRALLNALCEKLDEEHQEFLENKDVAELADMIEVALAIAEQKGVSESDLLQMVKTKREKVGGFHRGYFYEGDSVK